ncbi:hypothetical protein Tco_0811605 [Tanacetum coccineum]
MNMIDRGQEAFKKNKRVKKTHGLKRLYKVGLTARVRIIGDKKVWVEDIQTREDICFDANDEHYPEQEVATKDVNLTVDEVTLAQALAALKSVKPKVKANVVEEPSVPVSAASTKIKSVLMNKKLYIQAEFDEEDRLAREKDEAKCTPRLKNSEGYLVLRAKKKEDECTLSLKEQKRKKKNKLPTKTQQKKDHVTFLKIMEGDELEQEVTKKQKVDDVQETTKVDDDQEAAKIKELMEIVLDEEEVAIDSIPLAIKPPTIVD